MRVLPTVGRLEFNQEFETFSTSRAADAPKQMIDAQREALYQEFLRWKARKGAQAR
jgi:hypothetical protein